MKMIIHVFLIIALTLFTECDDNANGTFLLNERFTIENFQRKDNHENDISIRMDYVSEDSRCPANVVCVWEGKAEVKFIFSVNNNKTSFTLGLYQETIISGYKIRLLDLRPYRDTEATIDQKDYVADLIVEKV
jgi:hypothetical protein